MDKIKIYFAEFNKGKAPLHKKEDTKNNVPKSPVKPAEGKNNAEAKAEAPVKVNEKQQLEAVEPQQNHQEDNFEGVPIDRVQPDEAEPDKQDETQGTPMKEEGQTPEVANETKNNRESAPCHEGGAPCEIVENSTKNEEIRLAEEPATSTDVVCEFMSNHESAPCHDVEELGTIKESTEIEEAHQEEKEEPMPSTDAVCESMGNQESEPCHEDEPPCEPVASLEDVKHEAENGRVESEEAHHVKVDEPTCGQESVPCHESEIPCEAVEKSSKCEEVHPDKEPVPPTDVVCEFMGNQEPVLCYDSEPPCDPGAPTENEAVVDSRKVEEVHQEEEPKPSTDTVCRSMGSQESAPCESEPTLEDAKQAAVEKCVQDVEPHQEDEVAPQTEMAGESACNQESAPCHNDKVPGEVGASAECEVEGSSRNGEVHLADGLIPLTDMVCEYMGNQESAPCPNGEVVDLAEMPHETVDKHGEPPLEADVPEFDAAEHEAIEQCSKQVVESVLSSEKVCESLNSQETIPSNEHETSGEVTAPVENSVIQEVYKDEEVHQESTACQESDIPNEHVAPKAVDGTAMPQEVEPTCCTDSSPCVEPLDNQISSLQESGLPPMECHEPCECQDHIPPNGFQWITASSPLPDGAIDIRELHLPIYVGLVETSKGEIPCKYLDVTHSFYVGIDGREEAFSEGKILCLKS